MKYLTLFFCFFIFISCKENTDSEASNSIASNKNSADVAEKLADEVHIHGPGCKHEHFELKAPNGGTLVKLGGDAAVLEVLLDHKEGELKINVFDGLAKDQLKIEQKELKLQIREVHVTLKADDNGAFRVKSDVLKGMQKFEAEVGALEIEGLPFDGIIISYPEGN